MYRDFKVRVKDIAPHNMLALLRGETEGVLDLELSFDEEVVMSYLESQEIHPKVRAIRDFYRGMLKDAFNRLIKASLINKCALTGKRTDVESIKTFETNL